MYICRKVGLQFVERIVQLFGEYQRTGIRLFCHSEQYCRTCLLACHAELGRLVADLDVCDIGKCYHALAVFLHDAGTDLVDIVGRGDAADDIFVAVFIAHTTIGVGVHAACAGHNFEVRFLRIEDTCPHLALATINIVLQVPSGHHVEVVIVPEFRGPGSDHVGSDVIGDVVLASEVGVKLLHIVSHHVRGNAVGNRSDVSVK